MAAGDQKEGHSSEVELLASGNIADGAGSAFAFDNSSLKYIWAILIVNITAGAGSDNDGVPLHSRQSTDGGSSYTDNEGHAELTLPSPDSGTVTRCIVFLGPLGPNPGWYLKNDSGAQITVEVTSRFGHYNIAQS